MVQTTAIGERIKALRTAAGLSQQALAVAAGLSTSVLSQIEQGQKKDPRSSTISALARALGVSTDSLIGAGQQSAGEDQADAEEDHQEEEDVSDTQRMLHAATAGHVQGMDLLILADALEEDGLAEAPMVRAITAIVQEMTAARELLRTRGWVEPFSLRISQILGPARWEWSSLRALPGHPDSGNAGLDLSEPADPEMRQNHPVGYLSDYCPPLADLLAVGRTALMDRGTVAGAVVVAIGWSLGMDGYDVEYRQGGDEVYTVIWHRQ